MKPEARLSAGGMLRLRTVDSEKVKAWRESADKAEKRGDMKHATALREMADRIEANYRNSLQ